MNYLVDFGEPRTLPAVMHNSIKDHSFTRYVLFKGDIPGNALKLSRRIIETSDLDKSVFYWTKNKVDKDKEWSRLTDADKQEMTLMLLQCEIWP